MRGLFISFEGIDGAGKSTHIAALAQEFQSQGRAVTLTREPGGTPLAEALRALVLQQSMDVLTEALLVFAARRDHIAGVVLPALARGDVVVCDRFSDASFAYQGAGRGLDWNVLLALEEWVQAPNTSSSPSPGHSATGLLQPDLTLWFDLPAAVAAQRLAGARVPDKFESQPSAFFEKVASGYARRMQESPGRYARVSADQSADAVWQDVLTAVRARGFLA
jgi:dTMP kinase